MAKHQDDDPAGDRRPRRSATSPEIGRLKPTTTPMIPAATTRTPGPTQRPVTLLGFSRNQPRVRRRASSSSPSKAATCVAELGQLVGLDVAGPRPSRRARAGAGARSPRPARSAGARSGRAAPPAPRRPAAARCRCRPSCRARGSRRPRGSDQAAAGEVEHRRRQRPPRGPSVHDHRPGRRGQVGRRRGHVDRRIVEVDGVLAVPPPAQERPAGQAHEHHRRPDQPDHGVDLAGGLELAGVLRRRGRVDPLEGDRERAVEVGRPQAAAACRCRRSPGARRW